MAYPRQLRLSALPCESHVFEEAVIQMRTHCTFTGAVASCSVTVPPLPLVTTPPGNACHEPCAGFLMGSSPVQYCTAYLVAKGSAQAIRMALTSCLLDKSNNTHCGCSASSSSVYAFHRYRLLFQYESPPPSPNPQHPSVSSPSSRL